MVQRLGVDIPYNFISKYETNKNEPPLAVLLAYSRVSGIPLPNIIDDDLDLTRDQFFGLSIVPQPDNPSFGPS